LKSPKRLTAPKRRLDAAVADKLGSSRTRAQALILEGRVRINGEPHTKAGELVGADAIFEVEDDARFVGRGGAKLERALDNFGWSPAGLRCLDVGASTGGFTDCLLQRGAASVAAVDVGYGQIAWGLRNDPRVTVFERCNIRYASPDQIGGPFQFASVDVSFISIAKIAPALAKMLEQGARCIALVKPQFEAGRRWVARGGVVRDRQGQIEALESASNALAASGLRPEKLTYSPLRGPAGNIEFLLGAIKRENADLGVKDDALAFHALDIAGVVREAHEALNA
jgi:23S rRNA (cytidine1920-2'-O)/16S rRNA (cytidine1409-2'-O)-methyltransferase